MELGGDWRFWSATRIARYLGTFVYNPLNIHDRCPDHPALMKRWAATGPQDSPCWISLQPYLRHAKQGLAGAGSSSKRYARIGGFSDPLL